MRTTNRSSAATHSGRRRFGRAQQSAVSDPYKSGEKYSEPTICPQCGATYHNGRWNWSDLPASGTERLCQACHRINDHYPAGILTLSGDFVREHMAELIALARHQEDIEKKDHPLNRIIDIDETGEGLVINTTDIHLPRRIGEACKRAFDGAIDIHYDNDAYFVRVNWNRVVPKT
jgi:NMD protein affecting ribosome stability and mRNA decay